MAKITLFGMSGAGTSSTAHGLTKALGYTYISTGDIFRQQAKEQGMTLYEYESLATKEPKYDKAIDEEISRIGRESDNFVVESRLAWHFIPDSIKLKLECSYEERIKRLAERDGISIDEAMEKTTFRENLMRERWKQYYSIEDWPSEDIFDIIIDNTNTPLEEVVKKFLQELPSITKK